MSIDRLLAFIVVGLTALLVGGIGGLLLGATTEQASLIEALAQGDLTPDCQEQINAALHGGEAPSQ
ncbi:MAG: hypothetical protein R3D30_05085 [Hyphomicrobiales bacterium]